MQNMLKPKHGDPINSPTETFHPLALDKPQTFHEGTGVFGSNRDSGYGTDFYSPASVSSGTSAPKSFVFNSYEKELSEDVEEMRLDEHEDNVFSDSNLNVGCQSNDDDAGETDKEVEDLFLTEVHHSVSEAIAIQRPQAPTPEDNIEDGSGVEWDIGGDPEPDYLISSTYHHIPWTREDRRLRRFRPIQMSRSCGTQTPSPHSHMIREALRSSPISRPLRAKGRGLRVRVRTESGSYEGNTSLPDVVPMSRDRSVSLPIVPSYRQVHEQEVGRELRRISDEYYSSFTPVRRTGAVPQYPASLPSRVNIEVRACFNRVRRIVSASGSIHRGGQDDAH